MNEQLRLIDPPDPEWKLGAATRRVGLLGVQAARLERARATSEEDACTGVSSRLRKIGSWSRGNAARAARSSIEEKATARSA